MQYLGWPLGGASVEFGVEYVNDWIRLFTNVRVPVTVKIRRLRKAFSGVKLFHQIAGLVMLSMAVVPRSKFENFTSFA